MKNTLKNKSEIDALFSGGKSISDNVISIKYIDSSDCRFMFAVSSKKFRKAVDRNKIKRLMRESASKLSKKNKYIAFIYKGEGIPDYETINNSINKLYASI